MELTKGMLYDMIITENKTDYQKGRNDVILDIINIMNKEK